MRAVQIARE